MRNIKTATATLLTGLLISCSTNTSNTNDPIEKRVESLLSKMTLEEKIGQMNQISTFGNIEEMHGLIKKGEIGSILNEVDIKRINALQRVAVEESRLGIPLLIARDVIHGFKTIFPIPLGQAASFNPEIAYEGARVSAIEASSVGIRWTFAPMIDISRDPRWGRIAEGCGEDPYVTSVMGAAMIKGYQGDSLNSPTSIAACPKHFVGYGAAEGGRDYNSTNIPERLLRNLYLPPFEAAVEAGAATFMTSFNDNDGIPSTGNSFILRDVLRKEWGFDGLVVSDWASASEMLAHGFAKDEAEVAQIAANAGVDMEMVSYTYVKELPNLIKTGKVKQQVVDDAVRNILRIKFRLGLFENPYAVEIEESPFYAASHLEAAKRAAIESAILLKNENNTLPIASSVKRVAIVGPMANAPYEQLGTWVFDGEKSHTQTPLNAIKELVGSEVQVIFEPGLSYSRERSQAGVAKAVAAARTADVVIAFVGEESILSGEAHCLADLNLQGDQQRLISELSKLNKPLVTVVMAGRPLTIEQEVIASSALLYSFHPGTMGGPALADLIFGRAVPSGKTPVTFPKSVGQIPIYYAHNNTGRPATRNEVLLNNIPVEAGQTSLGCTSFYLDAGFDPLYHFGYGLSYTTFNYSNIELSSRELTERETLKVSFLLENSGRYEATEVAQLYIQDKVGSVTRPVKELKRFERITLKPGESREITFELPIQELAFWNIDMKKTVEAGEFNLWVAGDSQSGTPTTFSVKAL
ncbi:MAG: beta-glucosidase BglX [Bacteroidales bacterium]